MRKSVRPSAVAGCAGPTRPDRSVLPFQITERPAAVGELLVQILGQPGLEIGGGEARADRLFHGGRVRQAECQLMQWLVVFGLALFFPVREGAALTARRPG